MEAVLSCSVVATIRRRFQSPNPNATIAAPASIAIPCRWCLEETPQKSPTSGRLKECASSEGFRGYRSSSATASSTAPVRRDRRAGWCALARSHSPRTAVGGRVGAARSPGRSSSTTWPVPPCYAPGSPQVQVKNLVHPVEVRLVQVPSARSPSTPPSAPPPVRPFPRHPSRFRPGRSHTGTATTGDMSPAAMSSTSAPASPTWLRRICAPH